MANLDININISTACKLHVQDQTKYSSNPSYNESMRFNDLRTHILVIEQKDSLFVTYSKVREFEVPLEIEGLFTVHYLVIPNKFTSGSPTGYYWDDDHPVYVDALGNEKRIELKTLLTINVESTNIERFSKDFLSICGLKNCYIKICKELMNKSCPENCSGTQYSELSYKKDLLWMAINILEYLIEFDRIDEANQLLKQVYYGCNGLCKQTTLRLGDYDCGCT